MQLKSVFEEGQEIPSKYTCDGENISPPLEIVDAPEDAGSFVLIVEDPDAPAGTWDHWLLINLPKDTTKIKEGNVPKGSIQGKNTGGKNQYAGPCPPSGTHRYFFKLYALDNPLDVKPDIGKVKLLEALQGHVIEETQLMGTYSKK